MLTNFINSYPGFSVFILLYLGAHLLLSYGIRSTRRKAAVEQSQRTQKIEARNQRGRQAFVEGLSDWLVTLQLPQFENQTTRLEAAHQLSTVLIEKLWNALPVD